MVRLKVLLRLTDSVKIWFSDGRVLNLSYEQARQIHPAIASGIITEGYFDESGKLKFEYEDAEFEFIPYKKAGKELVPTCES